MVGGLLAVAVRFRCTYQFFRGFCDGLTAFRFNDWQNSFGFHGAYMVGFYLVYICAN